MLTLNTGIKEEKNKYKLYEVLCLRLEKKIEK